MFARLRARLAPYRKAMVAAVTGAVVTLAARYGFDLTETQTGIIGGLVSTVLVWFIPNTPKEG